MPRRFEFEDFLTLGKREREGLALAEHVFARSYKTDRGLSVEVGQQRSPIPVREPTCNTVACWTRGLYGSLTDPV